MKGRRRRRKRRRRESLSSRRRSEEQRWESSQFVSTLRLQCSPVGVSSAPCTAPVHLSKRPTGPQATAPKTTAGKMSVPLWPARKTSETIVYKRKRKKTTKEDSQHRRETLRGSDYSYFWTMKGKKRLRFQISHSLLCFHFSFFFFFFCHCHLRRFERGCYTEVNILGYCSRMFFFPIMYRRNRNMIISMGAK